MNFPGFCGPSYASQSLTADAQRTLNWIPELIESGHGKSPDRFALYPTPGLTLFSTLTGSSCKGLLTIRGRLFAISNTNFDEIDSAGTRTNRGTVADDGTIPYMAASATQILICSGGLLYTFTLATNAFAAVASPPSASAFSQVAWLDNYFIAVLRDSRQFFISALNDATTWDALDTDTVSVVSDDVLAIHVDHRELWLLGRRQSTVYFNSGNADFPFEVNPTAAVIEAGIVAPDSVATVDNSLFWLDADANGSGIVRRADGYTPRRVSNHAVESAMAGYSTISDAVGWSYQDRGHNFYVLRFPTANRTWVFDAATGMWHERSYLNPATGQDDAHKATCHAFCFGKHLVGDAAAGKVYELAQSALSDAGDPIKRQRRAPHISSEHKYLSHLEFVVDMETGIGPTPPLYEADGITPREPRVMMRYSNDGGKTWSTERTAGAGFAGEYSKRVAFRRNGRARDRVYEISCSDPVAWRIVGAYLEVA